MMPQTQTQGSGGSDGNMAIASGLSDDDDIEAVGDQIAALTLVEAMELCRYLEQVHRVKATLL